MPPPPTPRSPATTQTVDLPSSDPAITLECRLSLKPGTASRAGAVLVIAHPHALLGGSLRDPVATSLAARAAASPAFAAVCRANARGVGGSGGGRAVGLGAGPADVLAVAAAVVGEVERERADAGAEGLPPPRVYLAGYSWGACVCAAAAAAAAAAASSVTVAGVAAISPPLGLLPSLALGAGRAFSALADAPSVPLYTIIGDRDQFAGAGRVQAAVDSINAARTKTARAGAPAPALCVVVEGADHFWAPADDVWDGNWGEVAARVIAWCESVEGVEEDRVG